MDADPPVVLLKLDDLAVRCARGGLSQRWDRVADFLESQRIPAALGLIGATLELHNPEFTAWIAAHPTFEYWHHGYDHRTHLVDGVRVNEFVGRSAEEQRSRLQRTLDLARDELGLTLTVFGPPGGAPAPFHDAATLEAIADVDPLRVWLHPEPLVVPGMTVLCETPGVRLESRYGVVVDEPAAPPAGCDYLLLEGHPRQWDAASVACFERLVERYQALGCRFSTPSDYVAELG